MSPVSWLRRQLRDWLCRPQTPGPVYVFLGETQMASALRVTVALPPLAAGEAGEVVKRRLTRIVNGGEPVSVEFDATEVSTVFDVEQDDVVNLALVNIDDAGNVSAPSTREFTALDTIPPAAPGEMDVAVTEVPVE